MSPGNAEGRPVPTGDPRDDGAGSEVAYRITNFADETRASAFRLAGISDRLDAGTADRALGAQVVANVVADLSMALARLGGAS